MSGESDSFADVNYTDWQKGKGKFCPRSGHEGSEAE
jgi:hypothetical protein